MTDYISREDALAKFRYSSDQLSEKLAYIRIEEVSSADVTPVLHGRWIHERDRMWRGGGKTKCSNCKFCYADGSYHEVYEFLYCPHCGARMDKDGDGE